MENLKIYSKEEVQKFNPQALALIGDAVFSLHVREYILQNHNINANALTKMVNSFVNAGNQYKIYRKIEPNLLSDEQDICHRARNCNMRSKAKNYSITEYIYATAFEALLGYLHLTNNQDRLKQILTLAME